MNWFKKKVKNDVVYKLTIDEGIYQTMDNCIIRCRGISAYFNAPDEQAMKLATHDMLRYSLIDITHIYNWFNIEHERSSYEGAIRLSLNKKLKDTNVVCKQISIQQIEQVELRGK